MKNSVINSNREKEPIYDQNGEGVHRVKKSILHPPFSESQPEKDKIMTFFIWFSLMPFNKKNGPLKSVKIWVQQVLYRENQKTRFFRQKSRTLNEVLFWTPRSKFLDFSPWSKPGAHPGPKNVCRLRSIKGPK